MKKILLLTFLFSIFNICNRNIYCQNIKEKNIKEGLNISLKAGDFLAFYDNNGKLIDSMTINNKVGNINYSTVEDSGSIKRILKNVSIEGVNSKKSETTAAERFRKLDPWGVGLTFITISIAFLLLIIIYLSFLQISVRIKRNVRKNALIKEGKLDEASQMPEDATGDVYAVIGLALHMYISELHDYEEAVLTINKVSRIYSPWNSKIYSLRQTPDKR